MTVGKWKQEGKITVTPNLTCHKVQTLKPIFLPKTVHPKTAGSTRPQVGMGFCFVHVLLACLGTAFVLVCLEHIETEINKGGFWKQGCVGSIHHAHKTARQEHFERSLMFSCAAEGTDVHLMQKGRSPSRLQNCHLHRNVHTSLNSIPPTMWDGIKKISVTDLSVFEPPKPRDIFLTKQFWFFIPLPARRKENRQREIFLVARLISAHAVKCVASLLCSKDTHPQIARLQITKFCCAGPWVYLDAIAHCNSYLTKIVPQQRAILQACPSLVLSVEKVFFWERWQRDFLRSKRINAS